MKRKEPIALKTGNRVIAWSKDHHRNLPVVVTKVNSNTFQGETVGDKPEKVNSLSKLQAWTLKEFEKDYPEEFYNLYPHKRPQPQVEQVEETVNSLQTDSEAKPWNPDDFGELEFTPEEDGQLNILEPLDREPPDPDDFKDLSQYEAAWAEWEKQNKPVKEAAEEIDDNGNSINGHLPPVPELPPHDFKVGDRVMWRKSLYSVAIISPNAINIKDDEGFSYWVRDIEELITSTQNQEQEEIPEGYLLISTIEVLEEMQPRMFGLNFEAVNIYCDRIQNGEQPPPVIIYKIDGRNILVAGFHRLAATKQAGLAWISAEIKVGTWAEAKLEAATNNKNNGLQMGNQDIGKAIGIYLTGLEELPENDLRRKQSLREIASAIGCSHTYIARVKNQLAFERKIQEFNLVKGARFKHKELGSCGEIFAVYKTTETIILEWDIHDGNRYSGQMSVSDFLRDFEPTDLPKQVAAPQTVNSVQKPVNSVESETKAKGKSLGLPTSRNGVLPDCDDPGNGNCLQVDRTTPPEMEAPTPEQCYSPPEVIKINPADLVIGITSNIDLLNQEHCLKIWDAIADKLPDPIKVQDMTDNQLKALVKQAKEELNKRNAVLNSAA